MYAIEETLKSKALAAITSSTPVAFWADSRGAIRQTYMDIFQQVANDPNLIPEQRIFKLHQDRHFRMEHTLYNLAKRHDIPASATLLPENGYNYVYVAKGRFGLTQSYVPYIGALPKPARYWEKLADVTGLPRLNLGIEPKGIIGVRTFYALLTHNPVGKRFDIEEQKLGMIQLCIPSKDAKEWVVELTLEEIIAAYPQAQPKEMVERTPKFKKRDDIKGDEGS